jgi:hypothetical protein
MYLCVVKTPEEELGSEKISANVCGNDFGGKNLICIFTLKTIYGAACYIEKNIRTASP